MLYRPGEPQKYHYHIEDAPEVFWVHFTGIDVENIFRSYGLQDKTVFYGGSSPELRRLFQQMIRELQLCKPLYQRLLAALLEQVFLLLCRSFLETEAVGGQVPAEIETAVRHFNENYNKSISWFIRAFKRHTGLPPMQYILSLRMTNARLLFRRIRVQCF